MHSPTGKPAQEQTMYNISRSSSPIYRCVFASNFPVDRINGTFQQLVTALEAILKTFTEEERHKFFAGNARKFYRLWDEPCFSLFCIAWHLQTNLLWIKYYMYSRHNCCITFYIHYGFPVYNIVITPQTAFLCITTIILFVLGNAWAACVTVP